MLSAVALCQYNPDRYFKEGQHELGRKNYIKAIENLSAAIAFEPRLYDAYFFRAIAKFELEDLRGAEEDLSVAINIYPYDFRYFLYRGIIRSRTYNFRGALWDYEKAIDIDSSISEVYINRAVLNLSLRNFKAVLEDCKQAELLKNRSKDLYLVRGTAHKELEQYQKAIIDFNFIIAEDSTNTDALINRGLALLALKRMDSALVDFQKVLELDSNSALGYFYRGNWYLQNERNAEGIQDFNRFIQISDRNSAVFFNRAIAKSRLNKISDAIKDFDIVLKLSPDNITALYNRGGLKFQKEDLKGALQDYNRAIELYPKYADAYYNRSLVYKQMRKIDESEKDHRIAVYLQSSGQSFSENAGLFETGQLLKLTELRNDFKFDSERAQKPQYRFSDIEFLPIFIWNVEGLKADKHFAYDVKKDGSQKAYRLILRSDSMDSPNLSYRIEELDSIIAFNPKNVEAYFEKGIWQGHASAYSEAYGSFDKALNIEPNNFRLLFARANLKLQQAKELYNSLPADDFLDLDEEVIERKKVLRKLYQEVISDYDRVLELHSDFSFAYYNRAYAKALSDDFKGSYSDFSNCLINNKVLGEAFYNRGLITILFLQDNAGCSDLSRAGELGMTNVYSIMKRHCQ